MRKLVLLLVAVTFVSTLAQAEIVSTFRDDFNGTGALGSGWQSIQTTYAGDTAVQGGGYLTLSGDAGSRMFLTTDTQWDPGQDEYIKITARVSGGLNGFSNGIAFTHSTRASEITHSNGTGYRAEGVGGYTWADGFYDLESIMITEPTGREFIQADSARGALTNGMVDNRWYLIELTDDGADVSYKITDELNGDTYTVNHTFSPWSGLSSYVGFGIDARGLAGWPPAPAAASMIWDYFQVDVISGGAVPEPATLALLGLGSMLLRRRRS